MMRKRVFVENLRKTGRLLLKPKRAPFSVVGFSSHQIAYCRATPVCQLSHQRFGFVRSPLFVCFNVESDNKNVVKCSSQVKFFRVKSDCAKKKGSQHNSQNTPVLPCPALWSFCSGGRRCLPRNRCAWPHAGIHTLTPHWFVCAHQNYVSVESALTGKKIALV
jgi:hypothetical protein